MPGQSPEPSRPHAPGYDAMLDAGGGLMRWSWAEERLASSRNYWVSTVRPGGAPHSMPVWGIWLDSAFWFSTGASSRKARNLAHEARCVITTEHADEALIVEGAAEVMTDASELERFAQLYELKYAWDIRAFSPIFRVRPKTVFAFIEHASSETGSPTRWLFE